jgi:2-hydroxychromene-2-carboxylate isomerase
MIIAKRLKGKAISAWLGPTGDAARRAFGNLKERISKEPRRLDFYFDITDAWSYLTAQAVTRLLAAYPVELGFHTITAPASDVDSNPIQRAKHTVRDAQQLAEFYDVDFPGKKEPDGGMVRDFASAMIRERPPMKQLEAALEFGRALWTTDKKDMVALLGKWGAESTGQVLPILNTAYSDLRKAGHYQGAMLSYNNEWYWGLDRLPYLEEALAKDLGVPVKHVVQPRAERGPLSLSEKPLTADLWFSFRSPYSYIALEQIESVLAPYNVPLTLRPMLPMVSRGIPLPNVKRMYIVRDAKREADRLNIPFGEICDPLGAGVDRCIAIAKWAGERSQADMLRFAKSTMRGIWAEARDVADYVDLRYVVERAELPWEEAKAAMTDPTAQKWAQSNATDLLVFGLWGVPSMKVGDYIFWGQDRLPLLADRLRRHAANRP